MTTLRGFNCLFITYVMAKLASLYKYQTTVAATKRSSMPRMMYYIAYQPTDSRLTVQKIRETLKYTNPRM